MVKETAVELGLPIPDVVLSNKNWDGASSEPFNSWTLQLSNPPDQAAQILQKLETKLSATPVWLAANQIGTSVAGDKTRMALVALVASLIGIIAYLWVRFEHLSYGLAAVIAVLHDVLVTIGAIAVSYWLKDVLGFLQVEEFKISLSVVAAILTIIGYSLNDTIVIFDRIREVKGKSPHLTVDIINTSINQTLSRTILTSLTVLIVVVILYFFGGQGIHGFAYALVVGVIAGSYSTIFIASPILLWLTGGELVTSKTSRQEEGDHHHLIGAGSSRFASPAAAARVHSIWRPNEHPRLKRRAAPADAERVMLSTDRALAVHGGSNPRIALAECLADDPPAALPHGVDRGLCRRPMGAATVSRDTASGRHKSGTACCCADCRRRATQPTRHRTHASPQVVGP